MPTAHSHPDVKEKIISESIYVWPDVDGKEYGQSIEPLYSNQVKASLEDAKLYEAMALLDMIRAGKTREVKMAIQQLKQIITNEPSPKHN
jgi:hypothetical protein